MKNRFAGTKPPKTLPKIHGKDGYAICASEKMYTLRQYYACLRTMSLKSRYIKRLSKNLDRAIEMAHPYTGDNPVIHDHKLRPFTEAHEKFQFGKHEGRKVVDVVESHPGYCRWVIENVTGRDGFVNHLKALMDELTHSPAQQG